MSQLTRPRTRDELLGAFERSVAALDGGIDDMDNDETRGVLLVAANLRLLVTGGRGNDLLARIRSAYDRRDESALAVSLVVPERDPRTQF